MHAAVLCVGIVMLIYKMKQKFSRNILSNTSFGLLCVGPGWIILEIQALTDVIYEVNSLTVGNR